MDEDFCYKALISRLAFESSVRFETGTPEQRLGRGEVKMLRAMETYEKQTNRYQYMFFFCSATVLTPKITEITAEIAKNILNFLVARIS